MSTSATLPALDAQQILTTFIEMVKINSPSGEEELMCAYLQERVKSLKLDYRVDNGGNLIVDVPAYGCTHDSRLILSGHMDVVPPCHDIKPIIEERDGETWITSDNTTVLGADDKAGLAPILEAVAYALKHNLPRPAVRLVFTTREEVKLGGAKDLADKEIQDADFSVIFDHTGRQGVIIHQAPTYIQFDVEFLGKSVHAGIMPEQGVNALVFAAKVINQWPLGRLDEETTANIGFWNGGKATNIVPDSVSISGEIRGHDTTRLAKHLKNMQAILEREKQAMPGTDFTWSEQVEFEGYQLPANNVGLLRVSEAMTEMGLKPELIRTNGGSDNNVFMKRGLNGVVLSAGYMEPHSLKERVRLSEMVTCTHLILNLMACFARAPF